MHEAPQRDRGDGRATGQPSRGTARLDLRRTCSVRRKVSLSWACRRNPRTPGLGLCKTGRSRRQGHLLSKAHPEPLRSPRGKGGLPDFVSHPAIRQGLLLQYQYRDHASAWRLCGADHLASRHPIAEGRPHPRSQQVARA
jgi:hypothetical protein